MEATPDMAAYNGAQPLDQLTKAENFAPAELEHLADGGRLLEHPCHGFGNVVDMHRLEPGASAADQGNRGRTAGELGKSREKVIARPVHQRRTNENGARESLSDSFSPAAFTVAIDGASRPMPIAET